MVAAGSFPTLSRRMRRLASGLVILLCGVAAGCGGTQEAAGPLDEALGYLPAEAPLAVTIETDVEGEQFRSLDRLLQRFPMGDRAEDTLRDLFEADSQLDFERDVRPLLGNPFVVGSPDARSLNREGGEDPFVGAIQAADKAKLDSAVAKSKPKELGEHAGATVYRDEDGDPFAVEDDVLVVASSRALLDQALDRREGDDRLREEDFDAAFEELPGAALVRVYSDLQALLEADPDSRAARRVPWVAGLRTLGVTAAAEDDGFAIDYFARTDEVGEDDLPIAPGEESPGVVRRRGDVAVGIRDLTRIIEFGEAAAKAVNPSGFNDYETGKEQVSQLLGVNLDEDVFSQLKGDTAVRYGVDGSVSVRAELEDPAGFERTLRRLGGVLPELAEGFGVGEFGLAEPEGENGLWRLADSDGRNWFFGVAGDVFVLDKTAAGARRLASAQPEQVAGSGGAIVAATDTGELADAVLDSFGSLGDGLGKGDLDLKDFKPRDYTRHLADLVSSTSATPDGLRGSTRLRVE